MKSIKIFLVSLLLGLGLQAASELIIDGSHSHVTFKIKHLMITNVTGEFRKFDGEITADIKTKNFTKFEGTIDPNSIDTGVEKRDNHLRSPDFFDVKKFPKITYVMKSYDKDNGVMTGDLTIHGVTKKVKLEVEMSDPVKFRDDLKVGIELKGKINRKDFGLNWNKALETGGVLVGDNVKISIELETSVID